jgi:hypothetical protein
MANRWARDSCNEIDDFDKHKDLFLALMIFGDKTGTDVNQKYPLELWMFTVLLLHWHAREKSDSWRHLHFIPSLDFLDSLTSLEKLLLHHNYMVVLLCDLKTACKAKPVMWVNLGRISERRRLHINFCIVSGDQKSQDYICSRMSINGSNVGCIHHGCNGSAIHLNGALGSNGLITKACGNPPMQVLSRLNNLALLDVSIEAQDGPMQIIQDHLPPNGSSKVKRENCCVVAHLC